MFAILIGVLCFFLGLRGFSKAGLPLISSRNITGLPAKLIGATCCVVGCAVMAYVFYVNLSISQNVLRLMEQIQQR